MAAPWEKYKKEAPSQGPWAKYSTKATPEEVIAEESLVKEPGLLSRAGSAALGGLATVGEYVDRFTGAPVRKGIGALQEGKGLLGAAKESALQIGAPTSLAPTGKQIAQKAGISEELMSQKFPSLYSETGEGLPLKRGGFLDPTASGLTGLGIDIAADPTNLIPGFGVGKAAQKGIKGVEVATKGVKGAAVGSKGLIAKSSAKIASELTGVPAKQIETYATRLKDVNQMISKYGDDIATASDDIKATFNAQIQNTRKALNSQISDALSVASTKKDFGTDAIIKKLTAEKNKLNKLTKADDVKEIDDMINIIKEIAPDGKASIKDLFDVKEYLSDRAKGAYQKQGQIFMPGKESQRAAKYASAEARKSLNAVSPEIKKANNQLSLLHAAEDKIAKPLLKEGTPPGQLITAGTSPSRQRKQLETLERITGKPFVEKAENLAAMSSFASPKLLAADTTGKSLLRTGVGAGAGFIVGGAPGAAVGTALTSPAALKAAINAGSIPASLIKAVAGPSAKINDATVKKLYEFSQTPLGANVLNEAIRTGRIESIQEKNR